MRVSNDMSIELRLAKRNGIDGPVSGGGDASFDLAAILASKRTRRRALAARPIAEKAFDTKNGSISFSPKTKPNYEIWH